MKIFVGFGYNERDRWISAKVLPFIEELGCEVLTGEEMQGEQLPAGVEGRIQDCDACIGFLTKREQINNSGVFTTHRWVIEELAVALKNKKAVFEIRERGVDPQGGIMGDRQRLEFEEKIDVMLEIAKFISKEKSKLTHKIFLLLPTEFTDEIRPHLKSRDTRCVYRFLYRGKFYEPEETKLEKLGERELGIIIRKIPSEEAQIEITIEGPNEICWSSSFISVGTMNIKLQKDK